MEQTKSLSRWRFELQSIGNKHWPVFYQSMLGTRVSSYPRLYKALNNYGFWPLFEAIVASSEKDFGGTDPLNYVLSVARNKWKESEQEIQEDEAYLSEVKDAIEYSKKANENLAKKLKKVT